MSRCDVRLVPWKGRRACRITNGTIELTFLLGGGHIAGLRLCGSPTNALCESPWPTIEPQVFSAEAHSPAYGEGPVGRLLCGYTGHALALGYFGMPSDEEAQRGLPLHGEAVASEWRIKEVEATDGHATVTLEVELPVYQLRFCRRFRLDAQASTVAIEETVSNLRNHPRDFQWVQHAAFGEPLLGTADATLSISGTRGITWPLGYEGRELLINDHQFAWPDAVETGGHLLDISRPFARHGTGFVASVLLDTLRPDAFIAAHNRK